MALSRHVAISHLLQEFDFTKKTASGLPISRGHFEIACASFSRSHRRESTLNSEFIDAKDSPGFLLWQLTTTWQRQVRQALQPFKLTHTQFVLLFSCHWLSHQEGSPCVTQIQLAQHTKVDVNVTSQVLRTLEKRGLINRTSHSTDTRANVITVTPAGSDLAERAVHTVEAVDRTFFSVLGDTQKNEMIHMMLRLLNYIEPIRDRAEDLHSARRTT